MNATSKELMKQTAMAESQRLSDILDRQARMLQLLITEAYEHFRCLKPVVSDINKGLRSAKMKELRLFEHMETASEEVSKFCQEAAEIYPDQKAYWNGTAMSAEAFGKIMEAVFGYDIEGKQLPGPRRKVIFCNEEEEELFSVWLRRRKKVSTLINAPEHRYVEDGLTDHQRKWKLMPGWNAQPVVRYNEDGEWMQYPSMAQAAKQTGLNAKKIARAVETAEDYKGWHWVTKEYFDENKEDLV